MPTAGAPMAEHPLHSGTAAAGWLVSRRADFWVACGGASLAITAGVAYLLARGDRELDAVDLVFSDLHLGATYGAIAQRRLWARLPVEVLLVPALVVGLCIALTLAGNGIWITTALIYLAVWHRGRQNFGVAKFYQRQAGGPSSATHARLFAWAIYAPMIASVLYYTSAYPTAVEEVPHLALPYADHPARHVVDLVATFCAAVAVVAYFTSTRGEPRVHPGERWVVATHAAAFGAAYFLGAWRASFLLVLAVFHEVQYLYFAWAIARRGAVRAGQVGGRQELARLLRFVPWPALSVALGVYLNHGQAVWVLPLGYGVLLSHYWLDGVIWTGAAMRPAQEASPAS